MKLNYEYINKKIHIIDVIKITTINGKESVFYNHGNIIDTECPVCLGKDHLRINKSKNFAKCYSCGFHAKNTIDYYMKTRHVDFTRATNDLTDIFSVSLENNSLNNNIIVNKKVNEKGTPEQLDKVYRVFANSSVLVGEEKLSEFDKEYLLSRHLSEEDIEEYGFFSCPSRVVLDEFINELNRQNIYEYLKNTPGFNYDSEIEEWIFQYYPSIMIPMKNEFSQIVGIHKRNHFTDDSNKKGMPKYSWFSSQYCDLEQQMENGYRFGASSGSPLSVFYPKNYNNKIAITEGFFKAIILAKLGYIVISMQGVYSAKSENILEMIKNIEKVKGCNIKDIDIYFDTDMNKNIQVLQSVVVLCEKLKDNYIINIATWDDNIGKGIDDYINNNGNKEEIIFIDYYTFLCIVNEIKYIRKIRNINATNKNEIKAIFKQLEKKYIKLKQSN